ncbi:MAG: endonuclease III [Sedimentisphaerales bacterium]|jgi:endonuclease-3|nr:endonuclease III [Sedimentisphaerales bacterium]
MSKAFKFDKERARKTVQQILPILKKTYPQARIALEFGNPLELLIATILSAQCTDARVNQVTATLFKKYRTAKDWADVGIHQIEQDIKSTGFYRNKAANIKAACQRIVEEFGGQVPADMDKLLTLPGVGRKTANCVLGDAFGQPAITCDTHVIRLSRRLGLSENKDPEKLEFDLQQIVPREEWTNFSHVMITHGRQVCKARKPLCDSCPVRSYCPAIEYPGLL